MFNKKVVLGLLFIGLVSIVAGSITWAYFQDTEVSEDSTAETFDLYLSDAPFSIDNVNPEDNDTSGRKIGKIVSLDDELDLKITNASNNQSSASFSIGNIEPGDCGIQCLTIENLGSLDGELSIKITNITNIESNGTTEFENDIINGEGIGELGSKINMALWLDLDQNGSFDHDVDISLTYNGDTETDCPRYSTINSYRSSYPDGWDNVTTMLYDEDCNFFVQWRFPFGSAADNTTQGDSVNFDIMFILEQEDVNYHSAKD